MNSTFPLTSEIEIEHVSLRGVGGNKRKKEKSLIMTPLLNVGLDIVISTNLMVAHWCEFFCANSVSRVPVEFSCGLPSP